MAINPHFYTEIKVSTIVSNRYVLVVSLIRSIKFTKLLVCGIPESLIKTGKDIYVYTLCLITIKPF